MAKFLAQKKKLLEDIFEKASSETTEKSFSGITKYIERILLDSYNIQLSHKSFDNYYKAIVEEENGDYNIKTQILDDLSKFLGYNTFNEYCSEWKTIEYSIHHTISKIVINIINKPLLILPDFFQNKKANMGITGIILAGSIIGGLIYGGKGTIPPKTLMYTPCMYWNGDEYKITDCGNKDPHITLEQIDSTQIKYFKRITKSDTLTPENALGKIWYSKRWNKVDFFTTTNRKGANPKNGATLRPVTEMIIEKYAHKK
ncbi:hypothetical protein AAEZ35_16870 [Elizabethkingia anophelis subsp. anophelis]|uniref:hypothetical protein n=1 Tax=Elizabethkingia anophelis TaxID=1117645 RepID=UPI00314049CF